MLLLETLQNKKTSRPPIWFMRQAGRVLPRYMKLREKYSFSELMLNPDLATEVTLMPVEDLGVDAAILFSDILVIPQALGMELKFTDHGPRFTEPLIKKSKPAESLNPDPEFFKYIYAALKQIQSQKKKETTLIGFCGGPLTVMLYMLEGIGTDHEFRGAIDFFWKNENQSHQMIEKITDLSIIYLENQIASGAEVIQIFETWSGIIPASLYRKMFLPAVLRMAEAVKAKGTPLIFFPRGYGAGLTEILNDPNLKDKFDGVSVDWQTDINWLSKKNENKFCLQGNIDPRRLTVKQSNPDDLAQKLVNEIDAEVFKNNRYIFNLGHGILPTTPVENVQALVQAAKNRNW